MRRIEGSAGVKLIECTHPVKNKWRIRWDVQEKKDGSATYMEEEFNHKPTEEEIKQTVIGWINSQTDQAILSGFVWNGMPIWLSSENQFNYKAAYDLAVMSQGKSLPTVFKFGTTDNPVYYAFESLEDISDFYISAMAYINTCLAEGWKLKDSIDWSAYEEALKDD